MAASGQSVSGLDLNPPLPPPIQRVMDPGKASNAPSIYLHVLSNFIMLEVHIGIQTICYVKPLLFYNKHKNTL